MEFFKRTQPLIDFETTIQEPTEQMFEEEWSQASLFGWESVIQRYSETNPLKRAAEGDA
jgi:hypothetical protein